MRLIVGCPVAHRAWALPLWFRCLAAQTRRPDGFAFIHSGHRGDDTWRAIQFEAARHGFPEVAIVHDPRPAHPRHDNARFLTLSDLRNQMFELAREELQADLLLSLDTDVMLEDPTTIEHLEQVITTGQAELAAPVTWLHPGGEGTWAFNAGWWAPGGATTDPRRAWKRLAPDQVAWGEVIPIDVPMAVFLANRRVLEHCRYEWHESGEDLGFAQSIAREQIRCLWDTDLKCRHIWKEQDLAEAAA